MSCMPCLWGSKSCGSMTPLILLSHRFQTGTATCFFHHHGWCLGAVTVPGSVREKEMSLLLQPWCDVALFRGKRASPWKPGLPLNWEGRSKGVRQSTPWVRIMFVKTRSGICFLVASPFFFFFFFLFPNTSVTD